jgi:hypothetical protein
MAFPLFTGSRGFDVARLQLQLRLRNAPNMVVNGIFDLKVDAAVKEFQRKNKLKGDGVVGPLTQAALDKGPVVYDTNHNIALIAQPDENTCWAASIAMMTYSAPQLVVARAPKDLVSPSGGLFNSSESNQAIVTGSRLAKVYGLRCHAPMSWIPAPLCMKIRMSPLGVEMLWNANDYIKGAGSPGHVVVVDGFVSDYNNDGKNTYLHVLDPWPPKIGKTYWVQYQQWIRDVPTRTYRIYSR